MKPGQSVKEDDPLVEVMTDKATVMIPSPRKGKILETRGDEGGIIKVGAVLLTLDTGDGKAVAPEKAAAKPEPAPPQAEKKVVSEAIPQNHPKAVRLQHQHYEKWRRIWESILIP